MLLGPGRQVSCTATEIGDYTITGTLTTTADRLTATATLAVIDPGYLSWSSNPAKTNPSRCQQRPTQAR